MSATQQKITTIFNKQLFAFFKQIIDMYPTMKEFTALRAQLRMGLTAMGQDIAIKQFYQQLVSQYEKQVLSQDESFFLDFDLSGTVLADLNHLKTVYANATPNTKVAIWKYVRVLTLLSKKHASL